MKREQIALVTQAQVKKVIEAGYCQVTGPQFDMEPWPEGGQTPFAPSLDQIVPGGGYTPENTQVVVWIYNAAKNHWGDGPLQKLAKALCCGKHW